MSKRDHILAAMRNPGIVFFLVGALMLFGVWSLPQMNKDEFPQITIRIGVVAAIYPGATSTEIESQVTRPLEDFLLSYSEVNKERTYSITKDGVVYTFVELQESVTEKDEVWAKIRAGLDLFKLTSLPQGVLEVVVIDDFGSTSSVLLAMESDERTPRELEDYATLITSRLRTIPEMGTIKVLGQQHEEIAVHIDPARLSAYGIDQTTLTARLSLQGFRTMGGSAGTAAGNAALHVEVPFLTENEVGEQIVFTNPATGDVVRLRDVATISRRYSSPTEYVDFYEGAASTGQADGTDSHSTSAASDSRDGSCLIINISMLPEHNIVAFGTEVDRILDEVKADLPADIRFHRITDQPKVVNQSVLSLLRDIVLSILVVIAVMLLLFPLKTALVAGTGVPVCTAIAIGLMYLAGVELNTVTLASLIVVLGMIVDNSIIVVDGYTNYLEQGHSRWYSASVSTRELFMPMLISTLSISGMFFPMLAICNGLMYEVVRYFPWAIFFALMVSIGYAVWVTPYLSTRLIHQQQAGRMNKFEQVQNRFFTRLQDGYKRLLSACFNHPWMTLGLAGVIVALGCFLFTQLNMEMLPKAERDSFAVEIHLKEGCSLEETALVSDSMARILCADPRVKSVTSFVGSGSPRFHAAYQPQLAAKNYAQFIVNTTGSDATEELLAQYAPEYENHFSNAFLRFKQMDYQPVRNPIEVQFKGDNLDQLELLADSVRRFMAQLPELTYVHCDYEENAQVVSIRLKDDEADRLGLTQTMLSVYLSGAMNGQKLTTVWEDNYSLPVMLYTLGSDTMDYDDIADMPVPTAMPGVWVPLRQVADISPAWHHAQITRFNGVRTVTVGADLRGRSSIPKAQKKVERWIDENITSLPEGVTLNYGGMEEGNETVIPQMVEMVAAALLVMFLVMLYHFGSIGISLLSLSSAVLTLFGACMGLWLFGMDFSITAVLGVVSLIGIIVRNAIMMYEYAEQLRTERRLSVRDAAYQAGLRRMRPIFLTSATTALGVIPMIIARTGLWMPLGVVICFGTIFTLPLVVTVLPVAYWKVYDAILKPSKAHS